ncbi:MAG: type II toxin-antitoxin system RelE/ParE family toxin, partial [Defluviitaleaceae bacterium]|nr:type II toxin-antitoxin system RelE/ParE family toxin [Defluviitaleaceae bacterium]
MYERLDGSMPVQEFIQALQHKQQAKIAREIDLLEKFGSELHFPHVDTIKGDKYKGLWELRIEFASNIFRIFFFLHKGINAVLLHGIIKKSQKTPKKELDVALERMKEYFRRE